MAIETMRYRFIKLLLEHNITQFRARDVYAWLSQHHRLGKAYPVQAYDYVLNPLLKERLIVRLDLGLYATTPEAPALVGAIKRKATSDKKEYDKIQAIVNPPADPAETMSDELSQREEDEWDAYIAAKIKGIS